MGKSGQVLRSIALPALLGVAALNAQAQQIITGTFDGVVVSAEPTIAGTIGVGTTVHGSFEFLSAGQAPTATLGLGTGFPMYGDAITSFSITAGSYSASVTDAEIYVWNNYQAGSAAPVHDAFIVNAQGLSGPPINGFPLARFQFALATSALGTLSSGSLPTADELNAMWSTNLATGSGNFLGFGFGSELARFDLTGFSVQSVAAIPEPETYAMLLAGLTLLGFHAQRRRKSQSVAS
jgi:hypothetical protein